MRHEYTPEQALRRLIEKLNGRDSELAAQVVAAVNSGKDVQETERRGKKTLRFYRHTVPYSSGEALQIALDVLRSHFISNLCFMNPCLDNMTQAALGLGDTPSFPWVSKESVRSAAMGEEKVVEIELQTETEIIPNAVGLARHQRGTLAMLRISAADIKQQQDNFDHLRVLSDFVED